MKSNFIRKRWIFVCTFLFIGYSLFAQQITGIISDENGEPLPGVNVVIKGTTTGTVTDVKGKFSITVPDKNSVIQISYVSYLDEEFEVGNQTEFNITLLPDITSLDEVVVIGYGTVKRRDLTGSVASVSAKQIKDVPVTSTAQAITGRLAGVQITTAEGSPDAQVKIRVRGGGSITQDNSPLYIIDGFPAEGIGDIAPSDIESIDVLKDASSTAIYGARGANGVVIVTTKSGYEGKTDVNYNFYRGIRQMTKKLDVLEPYEYVLYQYERSRGSFQDRNSFENRFGTWDQLDSLYLNATPTDWQEEVFGSSTITTYHNLSVTGGSKSTNYNLSITSNDDNGIMLESGYVRNNVNFKFQHSANEKLRINFDAKFSDTKIRGGGTSDPGTSTTNKLKHSVIYRPVNGLSDFIDDPYLEFTDDDYYEVSRLTDPVTLSKDDYHRRHGTSANFNGSVNYSVIKGLDIRTEFGYNPFHERYDRFNGLSTSTARRYGDKPTVELREQRRNKLRWANIINFYKDNYADKHDINLMLGQELVNTYRKTFSAEARSFPENIKPERAIGSMELGEDPQNPQTDESIDKLLSYFGRMIYGYKDKYLASFTLRADGSTKFGPENRWGLFPSGSLAWRISQEEFMKALPYISSLKLRVSYGEAGNDRIGEYEWISLYRPSSSKPYFLNETEITYLRPGDRLANPFLKWETTITRNAGLDISLFRSRLNTTIDIYKNTVKDLLLDFRIPDVSGFNTQTRNIGQTSNHGIELVIDAYIIDKSDFKLSTNFNIAFNTNKVDDLGGQEYFTQSSGWSNDTGDDYIVKVGEPVGLMYGFVSDGYYEVSDFTYDSITQSYTLNPGVANNEAIVFSGFGPGSHKLKNLADPVEDGNPVDDGNLITFDDDRTIIGNTNPKHIGGLNIMMVYKGIDFSVFMNWVYGNDIYNANKIEFTSGYRAYTNLLQTINSEVRWRTVNELGEVVTDPVELAELNQNATLWKPQTGRYLFHSWAIEDGSFLRINNVTLGYTFPENLLNKIYIKKFRVYATVNNLYTFTNYSGYDPEVDTRRKTPLTPGVDYSAYPRSRMIVFGLNLTL